MAFMYCMRIFTFYPHDVYVSTVLATATWLAGWLAGWLAVCLAHASIVSKRPAKPILKLFRPSGSPIILFSSDPCVDTHFQ